MTNELALSLFTGFIIELIVLGISDKGKRTWVLIIGSILALAFALYPLFLSPKPPNQPYVLIKNHLVLPIKITVDNELRGIVKGEDERYFLLDSYPAPVKWHIIRLKNDTGQETGVNFAGVFTASNGNSTLVIDNKITG